MREGLLTDVRFQNNYDVAAGYENSHAGLGSGEEMV